MSILLLLAIGTIASAVDVAPGVQMHGYFQNRIYAGSGTNPEYRVERASISATAALPNDSTAYAEVYYQPWSAASSKEFYLESAYFDTKVGEGHIRVGKGRRMTFGITPAYPNRKTTNYGLFAEAFTQGRIQGVQYMLQKGTLDFGIAAHTAYRLAPAMIGDIPGDTAYEAAHTVNHISLVDIPGGLSRKMAVSSRLGGVWMDGKLKAGVSTMFNRMDPLDIATIGALKATGTKKNYRVWGPDVQYKTGTGFIAQGEWVDAKAASLGYKGYEFTAGWQPPQGWSFFARYAKQDMNIVPTANQLTWDTNQLSLSAVHPPSKGPWLPSACELTRETPPAGTAKVKNNLFFVELFSGF
jgi:hypothetical protein